MRRPLLALAAAVLLAGCSDAGDNKMDNSEAAPAMQRQPAQLDNASGKSPSNAKSGDLANTKISTQTAPDARAVAYKASLRVRVKKVEDATGQAKAMVQTAGGYVAKENTSGDPANAHLTFQVPSAQYATILDRMTKELGEKISLEQSAEDVTEQVADVDSRIKSAQSALSRLRTLLGQADTVGQVLQVSEEVDERQADLEALQARQKSLSQRTAFATVDLDLIPPTAKIEKAEEDRKGFMGGLEDGWDAFTAFVSGTLQVIGWLLPFTLLLIVLIPAWLLARRRRTPPPPPPAAAEERELENA